MKRHNGADRSVGKSDAPCVGYIIIVPIIYNTTSGVELEIILVFGKGMRRECLSAVLVRLA